jgi:hypothetical protein
MNDFEPIVTLEDALHAPLFLNKDKCYFYSFPLGVISIINFLTMVLIILSTLNATYQAIFKDASFFKPLLILGLGFITNIFMFYVQAYLIKGCKCAKLKKNNNL